MKSDAEADFLRLLISHICHELVSPIGAIGNGVELLEEIGTLDLEALELISQSSRAASAKLRLLRVVYGSAGLSSDFRLPEASKVLADLFAIDAKLSLDWPTSAPIALAPGAVQLAAALVLLAASCLPRGGSITASVERGASAAPFTVRASGTGARLPEEIRLAARGEGGTPDHKSIHAHYCAWAAARLGATITGTVTADAVLFSALLPFAAEA